MRNETFKVIWDFTTFRLQKIQLVNVQSCEEVNRGDDDTRSGEKKQSVEKKLAREISFPFVSIVSNSSFLIYRLTAFISGLIQEAQTAQRSALRNRSTGKKKFPKGISISLPLIISVTITVHF